VLTGHEEFTIRVTHELLRMNQALLILGSLLDTSTSVDSGKRCPKILPEDVLIPELAVDHWQFQPPGWRNRLCLELARSHERVGL